MFQLIDRLSAARLPMGAAFAVPGGPRGLTEAVLAGLLALPAAAMLWMVVTPAGPFGAPSSRSSATPDVSVLARIDGFFRTGAPSSLAEATAANSGSLRLFGLRAGGGDHHPQDRGGRKGQQARQHGLSQAPGAARNGERGPRGEPHRAEPVNQLEHGRSPPGRFGRLISAAKGREARSGR